MELGFLILSIFFVFWDPYQFFKPQNPLFGLRNPTFGGVILLKLFDLDQGDMFLGQTLPKNGSLKIYNFKTIEV